MKKINLLFSGLILLSLMLSGYQCSSAEMSSAKLYIQQKNWDKATESLNKEIAKNPNSDEAYYWLGIVCQEKDDIKGMAENFKKSLEISQQFRSNIDQITQSKWAESFNAGVGFYNKAAQSKSKDSTTMYLDKSLEKFNDAIFLEPDSIEAYKIVSMIYLNKGEDDNAVPVLEKIIDKHGSDFAYIQLADIYQKKGDASASAYKSSKNAADSVNAHNLYLKALDISKKGLNAHPGNESILQNLASIYAALNQTEEGAALFESEVKKNPKSKTARLYFGIFLTNVQNYTGAVAEFAEVLSLDPQFSDAYYYKSFAYYNWGLTILKSAEKNNKDGREEAKPKFELCIENAKKYNDSEKGSKEKRGYDLLFKAYSRLSMTKEAEEVQKILENWK